MNQTSESASETVAGVRFGVMTDEEIRKLSVVKITNRNILNLVGRPEPGGLCDPALGPSDDHSLCKTCGHRAFYCPGHCGHIDFVSLVYHPLLFDMLYRILQNTCLACYHFKAPPEEVEMCVCKLNLITNGDIVGARELDNSNGYPNDSYKSLGGIFEGLKHRSLTSFQLTEALSVLKSLLKKRSPKCNRCGAKNPPITKPTFGWFHMGGLNDSNIKANIIKGHRLDGPLAEGDDDNALSEVENAEDHDDGKLASLKQRKKKDDLQLEFMKWKKSRSLLPTEVRGILERLWENEARFCSFVCDIQQHQGFTSEKKAAFMMFFLKTLLVPPLKFRPPSKGGELVMEHPRTVLLSKILESNISLANAYEQHAEHNFILSRWMNLQQSVNVLFNSKSAAGPGQRELASGICQSLEKKEGLFRQKMMGKRVNFACRSVISPDPYLAVNEIGIPPVFALKLTYPERVTPWNVTSLREAIVNGPDIHPGATHYVDKITSKLPPIRKSRIAFARKLPSSRGVTTQPGKSFSNDYEGKVVHRHLRNGDVVLVNRQPTLHKPSIIALKVRVLPGEKTIRFHYANCDSFNADFDGDEINVHFPQDEISRAEAYNIVNADNQYIVPTRGDPKRALIQDHIVGAVLLTKRDTFLTLQEFNELLYMSGVCSSGASSLNAKSEKKISVVDAENVIQVHPPAIIKPQMLWTGKQVITAILNHVTRGSLPFTAKKRAKIAREYFGRDESKRKNDENLKTAEEGSQKKKKKSRSSKKMIAGDSAISIQRDPSHSIDEDVVFVYKNELVQGVIDKEQFGKFGLVHTVQEMYGSDAAGTLLSVLSRVLTAFLQLHGFTCGVDDILLLQPYDILRKKLLDICHNCGEEVHQQFIGREEEGLEFSEMQIEIEKAVRRNGESAIALLDGLMRSKLNTLSSAVTKLFPEGLIKPFRKNCLSLMTLSGAKGGTFNFQQISLLLGQQELEGKRVPRMVSGKTLPCFVPWDCSARAGGFISDRYLTGLRPQEFYFHCMAGREGLVDTAVKTSRSGYLQRCLIKNLECLSVQYDYTVRDADGSVIQFRYGEDGIDVHKKNYMHEYEALALNQSLIVSTNPLSQIDDGSLSKYIDEDNEVPNQLAKEAKEFYKGHPKDCLNFLKLVKNKYYMSLAQPGEPVGIIAAQSVGEPSTQMTLNTFHHAGRGEMNVTLGIPRLQEILMTASKSIRTPTMTCPLLKCKAKDDAEQLAAMLKRITVADLIENMEVSVVPFAIEKHEICSIYKLKIKLYDPVLYPPHTDITLKDCHSTLLDEYMSEMEAAIKSHLLLLSRICGIKSESQPKGSADMDEDGFGSQSQTVEEEDDDDDEDDDDNDCNEAGGDHSSKVRKRKQQDEIEYEDDSEEVEEGNPVADRENGDEDGDLDEDGEVSEDNDVLKTSSGPDSDEQKDKPEAYQRKKSDNDKAIYVDCDGLIFEVHFKLSNEPHILLAQIAEKVAKKVYVKTAGKIEQCKVVELHLDDSGMGGIPMLRKGKESRPALQTAGVDFAAFWDMQDELDVKLISSNDIYAMLSTYGVEAARATIITEIFTVFGHYGVTVDMRHLTLIADYMTHTGAYRPLSRSGGIIDSISPFSKMSYETASKFLTDAAAHGEVDTLETPSARICVGLPAKVGTGCFDLMHDLDV
ncbi:DNA-directed RNA polymerase I subunit 1-like [Chenopodium quinoa]|uniref:DNA-directed RNA polymerase I subunit 1-like n=1 Tax=Chenopodium quinoa TaxID=63459 RepID=UPI000B785406|nr:DNA-directed RNA polymerase I subunit 1-like [Chenopodium quinoa]